MNHYMLHTGELTLTAERRATADRNREETYGPGNRTRGGRAGSSKLAANGGLSLELGGITCRLHERERLTARYGRVAILDICGTLCGGQEDALCWYLGGIPSAWVAADAKNLADDPSIDDVILRINSNGGAVNGFSAIAESLKVLAEKKKVTAVVDDAAYSMACVISALAHEVYITPSGGMGNIGIICGPFVDDTAAMAKAGIDVFYACAPDGKSWGNWGGGLPDAFKESMTAAARRWYTTFAAYFESRGLSIDDVDAMNAAVYAGQDAVDVGLAHGVKTFDEVVLPMLGTSQPTPTRPARAAAQPNQSDPSGTSPIGNAGQETTMTLSKAQWDGLTPDDVRKARPDLVTAFAGSATPTPPAPATFEQLDAAFAGEDKFVGDCLRGKLTLEAAQQKYTGHLKEKLNAQSTELATLRGENVELKNKPATAPHATAPAGGSTAEAISKASGVVKSTTVLDPTGLPAGTTAQGAGGECPHKTLKDAIKAVKGELKCSEAKASTEAIKRWPDLRDK